MEGWWHIQHYFGRHFDDVCYLNVSEKDQVLREMQEDLVKYEYNGQLNVSTSGVMKMTQLYIMCCHTAATWIIDVAGGTEATGRQRRL